MTTKIILIVFLILAALGAYNIFLYWEKVENEQDLKKQEQVTAATLGSRLPGLPPQLETSLQGATQRGTDTLGQWLKLHGASVADPRKAWIELDYAMLLSRENPAEAKRIYAAVKARTKPDSQVYKRVMELEKTYR